MGLFDSVDTQLDSGYFGGSVLSGYDPSQNEFAQRMFGSPTIIPDGTTLIDQRANTSWFTFDQSKLTNSLFDVLKSGAEAAVKSGVQYASDAINKGSQQQNMFGSLFRNFRSTQTGAQISAASYATQAQNFLMNPVVWVIGFGLVMIVLLRK